MAGSAPTNSAAVDFQKQQAAEADAKEAKRQADLQQGISAINAIYDPQPVMQTTQTPFDWSTFQQPNAPRNLTAYAASQQKPTGVPTGYTAVQIPGTPTTTRGSATQAAQPTSYEQSGGGRNQYAPDTIPVYGASGSSGSASTTPSTWGLQDASGKIYKPGDALSISTQTPTGKTTGGFGDDYYNAYNQKILDYYMPEEQRQYNQAQRDLTYGLARAGTLQSSTAADRQGDLAYQDALNKAQFVSQANDQTGQLRDTINSDKQSLINQLYTTEDPTLTANLAQSSANANSLKDPTLTPVAGLFNSALSTVGSAVQNFNNPYSVVQPGTGRSTSPAPAPASQTRGVLIS